MDDQLTHEERQTLLRLARSAMERAVRGEEPPPLDPGATTAHLSEPGASFVTLTIQDQLRGCIGALEPSRPLVEDVREHAAAAALEDPRFMPVKPEELDQIEIELSRLSVPKDLTYTDASDLLAQLRPGVDGVILRDGPRRATFLPQVWEKVPERAAFLDHLCTKMGVPADSWRHRHLDVQTYQVEEFHE
jgi:AmmeMemoRadiSam system protein A